MARRISGFTLIEILVVVLIIGIMIVGTVLTTGVAGGDRELDKERDRVLALSDYLREQGALQNREYGIRCFQGGYEFLEYEPRSGLWQVPRDDVAARSRLLPADLVLDLDVEGRRVVLPRAQVDDADRAPQIMLYSSGEMSLFELTLRRTSTRAGVRFAPASDSDRIAATALTAGGT
jgi:general secretion pathway protein H